MVPSADTAGAEPNVTSCGRPVGGRSCVDACETGDRSVAREGAAGSAHGPCGALPGSTTL